MHESRLDSIDPTWIILDPSGSSLDPHGFGLELHISRLHLCQNKVDPHGFNIIFGESGQDSQM